MASLYCGGQVWWSKSYEAGKMVRTSIGTRDKAEARRRLRELEAQKPGRQACVPDTGAKEGHR
jgi:hypothetical protein